MICAKPAIVRVDTGQQVGKLRTDSRRAVGSKERPSILNLSLQITIRSQDPLLCTYNKDSLIFVTNLLL